MMAIGVIVLHRAGTGGIKCTQLDNCNLIKPSMNSGNRAAAYWRNVSRQVPGQIHPYKAFHAATRLHRQGRLAEAEQLCKMQLRLTPDHPDTLHCLAIIRLQRGDAEDAEQQLRKAIRKNAKSAPLYNSLGYVLQGQRRHDAAAAAYRKAIAIDPVFAIAMNNLGNVLLSEKRYEEAITEYGRALAIKPDYVEAYANLAGALLGLNRYEVAVATCDRGLALRKDDPNVLFNKGVALSTLGRFDEARHAFEITAELMPRNARVHGALSETKQYTPGDRHLAQMEALTRESASLPDEDRIQLHFALGKAYMDLGQHEVAFRQLLDGNGLKRRMTSYDECITLQQFDRIGEVFSAELIAARCGAGFPSRVPIFILGMPRSGTTLVEQILASHREIYGAGELPDFEAAVAGCCESVTKSAYPEAVPALGAPELSGIGARYVAAITTGAEATNARRITDKMPGNFRFVGLIHLALPSARIIHIRRQPIDTCLSCFSKLFGGDQPFSYNLVELGRYYRAYERLMQHWRRVLPQGAMLEVDYEEVVADLEGQARRILEYCGLDWDPNCLDFHETRRAVKTLSAVQVRQPIYRSSVGRWRPYRHLLAPLLEALEMDPVDADADDGSD
jgi:tetratricopeptide (TPR) repeat protein